LKSDTSFKIPENSDKTNENNTNDSIVTSIIHDLNENGIDYRLTGYIEDNETSIPMRFGVYINEKDIDKFNSICKKYGLSIIDRRANSKREIINGNIVGEANINAKFNDGEIDIAVQEFERLSDNSIVTKDSFIDKDGNQLIKTDYYRGALASELFDSDVITVAGNKCPIVAPEFEYISKRNSTNEDDIKLVNKLEGKIDNDRVIRIQELAIDNYANQISTLKSRRNVLDDEQKEEISMMMINEETHTEETKFSNQDKKPKQFVKSNNNGNSGNNAGYISKLSFIFFLLLIIVLALLGFLLLNM
jgi:hypothetical protein